MQRIEALLCEYVTDDPQPNRFYQCQYGDTLDDIARAALGTLGDSNAAQRLEYIHCIVGVQHNLDRYGTPSTGRTHPPRYLLPGLGLGLRAALLPRNDDALALMLNGLSPTMRVDPKTGAPTSNATSRGLVWLPPVDPKAFLELGEVTCGDDGLEPPAELLGLLQEAA